MKPTSLTLLVLSSFASVSASAAEDDVRRQPVHNLNGTGLCFNQVLNVNAGPYSGEYDTPVRGASKRVKCSLRVAVDTAVVKKIGTCPDPNYTGPASGSLGENGNWVDPDAKKKRDDRPPFKDLTFDGQGISSAIETVPVSKRELTKAELAAYLEDPNAKKWERVFKPKHSARYFIGSAEREVVFHLKDPKAIGYKVQDIVCRSKNPKKFKAEDMLIGDLVDAFGGRLRLDVDPTTDPSLRSEEENAPANAPEKPAAKTGKGAN